ncbi:hypothetical protein, partial [Salibacterium halotolerans]|uniref:hypothetical protein n=1 Tax=Salibacterium halotolerans TaxID=1884432 RepID=UPI001BAEBD26
SGPGTAGSVGFDKQLIRRNCGREPCPGQRRHDEPQRIDVALVLRSKSKAFWRSGVSKKRRMPNDLKKSFGILLSYKGFVPV